MVEGLKIAKKAGKLNGPGLKAALGNLEGLQYPGAGCAPITYTPTDHRPNTSMAIGGVKDGKVYIVKDVKFPREAKYIGW
jgi:branched-chain amino acid transport system substrate-binding protein